MRSVVRFVVESFFNRFGFVLSKKVQEPFESLGSRIHGSLVERAGGVLHIGAHKGQEAEFYNRHSASVLWIEANPELYKLLKGQLAKFSNQNAMLALLGDEDKESVPFHVSSNNALSSSIYEFGSELGWENLRMTSTLNLPMIRLDSILSDTDASNFPHWVLDVQGSELNVLKGSGTLLRQCLSIYTEVSTREVYKGGVLFQELKEFLNNNGFIELWNPMKMSHEDIMFVKVRLE